MERAAGHGASDLQAKQIELLYGHLAIGLIATSINAVILALVVWTRIAHPTLVLWLVCIELVVFLRYILLVKYRRATGHSERWGQLFLLGTAASGLCWGSAGILLFAPHSIAHQAFLTFVLGGMASGAVTAYSPRMPVILAFLFPALIPITARFFAEGDEIHLAMGGMVLLFTVLMVDSSRRTHQTILKSLRLEIDNRELIAHLTAETTRAKRLNDELLSEIAERHQIEEDLKKSRDFMEQRVTERTAELQSALDKVKVLRGLLPICSQCKKIRNDQGYWTQLEVYIHEHAEVEFTHSLCPACAADLFPGFLEELR
jgi:two-component system cell cycle sensor histidine kinase/response regulator CckA